MKIIDLNLGGERKTDSAGAMQPKKTGALFGRPVTTGLEQATRSRETRSETFWYFVRSRKGGPEEGADLDARPQPRERGGL